jgi:hypothetical protein
MTETRKIVLIKSTQYGLTRIINEDEIQYLRDDEFAVSMPVDVEFEMLPRTDHVNNEIEILKTAKSNLLAEAQVQANAIDDKIQHLLAIENNHG